MGRPGRPPAERQAVLEAAAQGRGSKAQRANRLAARVAAGALLHLDSDPAERVLSLLSGLDHSPLARLIADPAIDTAAAIRAERAARAEARGWRRLSDLEAAAEDRAIIVAVTALLSKRYARVLAALRP